MKSILFQDIYLYFVSTCYSEGLYYLVCGVYRDKKTGVYETWATYSKQVTGHKKNSYKNFPSKRLLLHTWNT